MAPTAVVVTTPAPAPTLTPEPTAPPAPTATSAPTPTSTAVPRTATPVPTATLVPVATSTPLPPADAGDSRYGVVMHTKDLATQTDISTTLGTKWHLDFSATTGTPAGTSKPLYWRLLTPPTASQINSVPAGSVWYPFGEANRTYTTAQRVAPYHDFYAAIKAVDPKAKVTSPSMLNWDFTCIACGGYTSGHVWLDDFRTKYLAAYREDVPFDIWAIDVYPIDWVTFPTTNAQRAIDQMTGMRSNMAALLISKPIWVTGIGLHWGYSEMEIRDSETYHFWPKGTYREDLVLAYFNTLYT